MKKIGFDNDLYVQRQRAHILERISRFNGKLYLEFGGKLFDDYHASRVLPGFQPDAKIRLLQSLSPEAEIVFCISAGNIEKTKIRADLGISYEMDLLRQLSDVREMGISVNSVVITQYTGQTAADQFIRKLDARGIRSYIHRPIKGYPSDVDYIVSDQGYGANPYIETTKPLVVVTAPGPGSGKLATCLSQVYHEHRRGVKAGYGKYETFPIWNLPLKHPVNLAYEAATADLADVNMIDPFHLEAYGETTVNYNRDVEIFPVLNAMFQRIYGESPYKSPTDMGVNMAGNCICDNDACVEASCQEIIRRYYDSLRRLLIGACSDAEVDKIEMLMNQVGVTVHDRPVVDAALNREKETGAPAAALQLHDGRIVTGKTSNLLGASAALLLNALKELAEIPHECHVISPEAIEPIQKLKTQYLGSKNPRLHTDEVLIALSVSAATNETAQLALDQLPKLKGCQAHTSVMVGSVDMKQFKKLSIQATFEAKYEKDAAL